MAKRPLIGVTGPDRGGLAAWWCIALALYRAGARVQRITPRRTLDLQQLDGLVISGGADVSPTLYGQPKIALVAEIKALEQGYLNRLGALLLYPLLWGLRRSLITHAPGGDEARDRMEYRLLKLALAQRLPVLGICRGMQLLNVVCQGSLHQNLQGFYREAPQIRTVLPRKAVIVIPQTRLAQIVVHTRLKVNALHHQAIDRLGQGLCVAAQESNGITQAIEHRDYPYVLGVQWHPEYLPQKPEHQALFHALVEAARNGSASAA
ncbi:gamma-glutamyl-gamma-aminobutyrate hydrolase [Thiorhodospira sibirica]|uniref:gamma-glutamyl-gamma-aminobutyrate hydrolase n=1 Tax=Thiorhodospira sibirica TaxID=154347 RepID=UPI00022C4C21|nr:gamma-glutamyl-gamma-aminobutyrate hydrolase [Thiorhodospira sibirica]